MTKRRQKSIAAAAVLLLLMVGAVGFWSLSGNDATISNQTPATATKRGPAYQTYDGQYMSFEYPSIYTASKLPAKDNDLELVMLTADTTYQKQLAVALSTLPDGKLDSNSAYKLRSTQTENYHLQKITVDGAAAEQADRLDGTEVTVFIPRAGKVAVLAFSETGGLDSLQPEVAKLLTSYHWK